MFRKVKTDRATIQFRKSKQLHRTEIKKLKKQIKKHKLLLKQAKLQYKITK